MELEPYHSYVASEDLLSVEESNKWRQESKEKNWEEDSKKKQHLGRKPIQEYTNG